MGFLWLRARLAAAESETCLSCVATEITQTILSFLFSKVGEKAENDFRCYQHHEAEMTAVLTEANQLC